MYRECVCDRSASRWDRSKGFVRKRAKNPRNWMPLVSSFCHIRRILTMHFTFLVGIHYQKGNFPSSKKVFRLWNFAASCSLHIWKNRWKAIIWIGYPLPTFGKKLLRFLINRNSAVEVSNSIEMDQRWRHNISGRKHPLRSHVKFKSLLQKTKMPGAPKLQSLLKISMGQNNQLFMGNILPTFDFFCF